MDGAYCIFAYSTSQHLPQVCAVFLQTPVVQLHTASSRTHQTLTPCYTLIQRLGGSCSFLHHPFRKFFPPSHRTMAITTSNLHHHTKSKPSIAHAHMHRCILVHNKLTRALNYPPYVCFCSQHWNQGGYGDFQGSYGNVRLRRQILVTSVSYLLCLWFVLRMWKWQSISGAAGMPRKKAAYLITSGTALVTFLPRFRGCG